MNNKTPQRLIIVPLLILALVILQFAVSSPNVGAFASVGNGINSILPSLAGPEVDTLNDEADGSCADGDCSLRDAIATASPGDTITFSVNGTITFSGLGELVIGQNLTIDGGGNITVSGNNTCVSSMSRPAM